MCVSVMSNISRQTGTQTALRRAAALAGPGALAILALVALALLWGALTRLVALLNYPYPHDGLEGTLLSEARLLRAGAPLYQPLEQHRFISAPYPPVHALALALADGIAGPHLFWGGRLLSLVAALGVATLIVLLVRRAAGSWTAGLLGAALFLSAPPVILWATRIKPDMLALLWTALGLCLASFFIEGTGDRGWGMGDGGWVSVVDRWSLVGGRWSVVAICFALAFFTKQTALAAPLATGLALLIADIRAFRGDMRVGYLGGLPLRPRTLAFGLIYAALIGGTWLLLDAATRGQFSFHIWVMHREVRWSGALLGKFVALLAPYLPAALIGALLVARALRDGRALVPACYLLVAPLTLLGAGESGANHNHLLETLLALALTAGIAVGWVAAEWPRRMLGATAVLALFALQFALAFQPQQWYTGELAPADPPDRYLAFIRSTPGEVLADDVGLLFMAGRPLRYDDPAGIGSMALSGAWDQRGLLQEIAERRFSAIMIPVDVEHETSDPAGRWTPEMLSAIREHYRLAFHDTIVTYLPK